MASDGYIKVPGGYMSPGDYQIMLNNQPKPAANPAAVQSAAAMAKSLAKQNVVARATAAGQAANDQAYKIISNAPIPTAQQNIDQMKAMLDSQAQANQKQTEKILGSIPELMRASAEKINQQITEQTISNLDRMSPGWRESQAAGNAAAPQVAEIAKQFMTTVYPEAAKALMGTGKALSNSATSLAQGIVPNDVIQQVRQSSAEKALIGTGMDGALSGGAANRNLMARDLGLTSLDMMTKGAALSGAANAAYGQVGTLAGAGSTMTGNAANTADAAAAAYAKIAPKLASGDSVLSAASNLVGNTMNATIAAPGEFARAITMTQQEATGNEWAKRVTEANSKMQGGDLSMQAILSKLFGA